MPCGYPTFTYTFILSTKTVVRRTAFAETSESAHSLGFSIFFIFNLPFKLYHHSHWRQHDRLPRPYLARHVEIPVTRHGEVDRRRLLRIKFLSIRQPARPISTTILYQGSSFSRSFKILSTSVNSLSNQFRQVCCPYFLCELCIQCRPLCDVSLLIVHVGMKLQPVLLEEISEVRVILICHCCQRPTRRRASAGCRNNSSMHDRASGRRASTELRRWNRSAASEDR